MTKEIYKDNPYKTFPVEITKIVQHTDIDFTFFVKKGDLEVKRGQFVQVSIPKYGELPISISDFTEDEMELTIREVGTGTEAIFGKEVGDTIQIRGPYGNHFEKEKYFGKDLVIITGGTGLAPIKGIVNYFAENPDKLNSFRLISGFKSSEDILFKEDFIRWEETVDVCLTIDEEEIGWAGNTGFVTEHCQQLVIKDLDNVAVIMIGPPPMMKFTAIELQKLGIKDEDITVSYERRMSCGVGKCGHCKMDDTYICLDGPIFQYDKAVDLID